ncbi:MAG: chromosomal replication initiator protein DnaA [Hyphomicrobiaceae bacterium]
MMDKRGFDPVVTDGLGETNNAACDSSEETMIAETGDTGETSAMAIDLKQKGPRIRAILRAQLGEEIFKSWFGALEFERYDGEVLRVTVPVKFLKSWIQTHYADALHRCAASEIPGLERVEVHLRQPGGGAARPTFQNPQRVVDPIDREGDVLRPAARVMPAPSGPMARTIVNGLEGSPLDPRYTFESFVVGAANRMAHAGATQVAETVLAEQRGFNPLYIHSGVGHGKTHLLHAIAWEARRRTPHAQVLYLTAERFRFQFVEALKAQDAMAFKDRFRSVDMLLIDDLEFMHGEKTELEFDHIINTLLDGGRQLVVASARPASQLSRLNDRMRSRLQRGLVTEIGALDLELRRKILERRIQEKRITDPSFEIPREVVDMLSSQLSESGRELEGAVTRLYATWQYMRTPITLELVESVIRDLIQTGGDQRRIKIEDILKVISRHYGISRGDILSQRRHRSVVWPRQIGMYLAKQLTSRSLPEIGRRFGNRDHTTVLHAIRKVENELGGNTRLKEELDDLKKQIGM